MKRAWMRRTALAREARSLLRPFLMQWTAKAPFVAGNQLQRILPYQHREVTMNSNRSRSFLTRELKNRFSLISTNIRLSMSPTSRTFDRSITSWTSGSMLKVFTTAIISRTLSNAADTPFLRVFHISSFVWDGMARQVSSSAASGINLSSRPMMQATWVSLIISMSTL